MTELEEKLWKFEVRLKDVLEQLVTLRAENENLTISNKELTVQLESQKNIIKDLEENNKRVKLAGTMSENEGDRVDLKKQIEGFVKEIDRCIALLND
ncbi:MAG: hypothetical protein JJ975_06540 [Bacteroidia bacterium]|nr:hypothetical protein [Bacteroidia bacterium]